MNQQTPSTKPRFLQVLRRALNLDILFLTLLVIAFAGMIWDARDFRFPAGQLPQIVAGIGLGLIVIHALQQLRRKAAKGRILDISYGSYAEGVDSATIWRRTAGFFVSMLALFAAVWLAGFHVGAPLFVFVYLKVLGQAKWWVALWPAIGIWLAVVLIYGVFANAIWHVSVLESLLDVRFQAIFERPFQWLR